MERGMANVNLIAGWIMVLVGFVLGALFGIFAQKEDWLGGYTSRRRRLVRLGLIALIGLGMLNIIFWLVLAVRLAGVNRLQSAPRLPLLLGSQNFSTPANSLCGLPALTAGLLLLGGVLTPLSYFLSAMDFKWRYLFPLAVIFLIAGAILTIILLL